MAVEVPAGKRNPTKLYFGEDSLKYLNEELPKYGRTVRGKLIKILFFQNLYSIIKRSYLKGFS